MFTRRLVLTAAASVFAFGATVAAHAADWKTQIPELTFALVPAENAAETNNRWQPMMDYLSKKLGVKVTLRIVNDYAAVIEGQKAGNIHIALLDLHLTRAPIKSVPMSRLSRWKS